MRFRDQGIKMYDAFKKASALGRIACKSELRQTEQCSDIIGL